MRMVITYRHSEFIASNAYKPFSRVAGHSARYDNYLAARALGNYALACEEDHHEAITALHKRARNKPMFELLVSLGACVRGLERVAVNALDFEDLGELIRTADTEDGMEDAEERDLNHFLLWCEDNLDADEYEQIVKGYDNV